MKKFIEIIVRKDGSTTVQTKGFVGNSCREASRFVEQALGSMQNEKITDEFYGATTQQQPNTQSN
jgi:hypothetical protein